MTTTVMFMNTEVWWMICWYLAPVEVDGSQFSNMQVCALRAHTRTGQDLWGVLIKPSQTFVLCIHFLCKSLTGQKALILDSTEKG